MTSENNVNPSKPVSSEAKLIVILEQASLELIKVDGKENQLLDPEKHLALIKKQGRDPSSIRPDITHQCLMMLQDSPLNRAGMLQVYIRTQKNVLIRVDPHLRCPRSYARFCTMMQCLLERMVIRAVDKRSQVLLRIVRGPVSQYFPPMCAKFATSVHGERFSNLHALLMPAGDSVANATPDFAKTVVVATGAMPHGAVKPEFPVDKVIRLSQFPLSGALACCKLCTLFEMSWLAGTATVS